MGSIFQDNETNSLCSFQAFHKCGVARHADQVWEQPCAPHLDKRCTTRPPGWRLADTYFFLPPQAECQSDGKVWWPCSASHHSPSWGTKHCEISENCLSPPIASFPPTCEPTPSPLGSLQHQTRGKVMPTPTCFAPRGDLKRNNGLHVHDPRASL